MRDVRMLTIIAMRAVSQRLPDILMEFLAAKSFLVGARISQLST